MSCQMIRVISSPSSSTTGFVTLISAISSATFFRRRREDRGRADGRQKADKLPSSYSVVRHMSSAICLSWTTEDGGHTTEGRPCSILGQLSPVLRRVSRRDRLADVGKAVVLMADRKQ